VVSWALFLAVLSGAVVDCAELWSCAWSAIGAPESSRRAQPATAAQSGLYVFDMKDHLNGIGQVA
jgi:hypothetical protein